MVSCLLETGVREHRGRVWAAANTGMSFLSGKFADWGGGGWE